MISNNRGMSDDEFLEYCWSRVDILDSAARTLDNMTREALQYEWTTPTIARELFYTCPKDKSDIMWPIVLATAVQRLVGMKE